MSRIILAEFSMPIVLFGRRRTVVESLKMCVDILLDKYSRRAKESRAARLDAVDNLSRPQSVGMNAQMVAEYGDISLITAWKVIKYRVHGDKRFCVSRQNMRICTRRKATRGLTASLVKNEQLSGIQEYQAELITLFRPDPAGMSMPHISLDMATGVHKVCTHCIRSLRPSGVVSRLAGGKSVFAKTCAARYILLARFNACTFIHSGRRRVVHYRRVDILLVKVLDVFKLLGKRWHGLCLLGSRAAVMIIQRCSM